MEMRQLRGWLVRLFGLFQRKQREREFAEELESHLAFHIEDNLRAGMSPEEARRRALIKLGGVTLTQERYREQRGLPMLETLLQDLRFGLRMLRKNPGFSLVAILTLALGIGANTAIFSVVDKVMVRRLPVSEPERLVRVVGRGEHDMSFSQPLYADYLNHSEALLGLVAYSETPLNLSDGTRAERAAGLIVSGNYFAVLGVTPALGRTFLPEEDRTWGTHPVAVVSYGLWQRRFGADPKLVGRTISLNGYRFTVVGVAPPEFTGVVRGAAPDVYVPLMMSREAAPQWADGVAAREMSWLSLIGRLKPGVRREQAEAALSALAAQYAKIYPKNTDSAVALEDGRKGETEGVSELSTPLVLLMAAVGLVLLIACANVANLLLARAAGRRKEIAVRLAVGASRGRLVRQLLTESLLLSVIGGALGLLLAIWLANWLTAFSPPDSSFAESGLLTQLDWRVLGFAAVLSLLTGVFFGLAPALQSSKPDLIPTLKDEMAGAGAGRRWLTLRNLLVAAQVALSCLVLVGAGLCVRSLRNLVAIDAGFEPAKVVVLATDLALSGYTEERGRQFYTELLERTKALPGVESASLARIVPLGNRGMRIGLEVEGYTPAPNESIEFDFNLVGPDYFRTMKMPLVRGREFTPQDEAKAKQVVIINEAVARTYWPGQDPIGKRLFLGSVSASQSADTPEVIGVVKDSKYRSLTEQVNPTMFLPVWQHYRPDLALHVRTAGNAGATVEAVRTLAQSLDASLPIYNVRTLEEQKQRSLYAPRLAATLLGGFGLLALALAALGLYGVMSYAVAQRMREIGVRLALGAQSRDVFKLIARQGLTLAGVGLMLGIGSALALTRLMQTALYGVSPTDPLTFTGIALLLTFVASLACWIPARRATTVDPLTALRHE
jgi:predicted permease